jgi:hypothetical protein
MAQVSAYFSNVEKKERIIFDHSSFKDAARSKSIGQLGTLKR